MLSRNLAAISPYGDPQLGKFIEEVSDDNAEIHPSRVITAHGNNFLPREEGKFIGKRV
jgi:hypothetical protein